MRPSSLNKYLWLLVIGITLGSCTQPSHSEAERLNSIFNSNTTCSAPCWNDITPGISSETDLLYLAENSSDIEFEDFRNIDLNTSSFDYLWTDRNIGTLNRARFQSGILTLLEYQLLDAELSMKEIEMILGQPDAYGASTLIGEYYFFILTLIYEQEGVVVDTWFPLNRNEFLAIEANCEYELDWEMLHNRILINLTTPASADIMVTNLAVYTFEDPSNQPQPWPDLNPLPLTWCRGP